jgi:hypothetical protein
MSAEANNIPIDDDLNTTAPQDKRTAWKMPEPVFKRTSGRLPKAYEKQFSQGSTGEHETAAPSSESVDSVEAYVEPKPKNPTLKILVVVLALMAMAAFIAVFLTVLYFFFLR